MNIKSIALVFATGLIVGSAATSVVTPPAQAASKWEYKQRVRQQNREIRHLRRQNRALRWERTVPVYRGRYLPAVRDYALPVYHRRYVPHYRLIDHDVRPIRPRAGFSLFGIGRCQKLVGSCRQLLRAGFAAATSCRCLLGFSLGLDLPHLSLGVGQQNDVRLGCFGGGRAHGR